MIGTVKQDVTIFSRDIDDQPAPIATYAEELARTIDVKSGKPD